MNANKIASRLFFVVGCGRSGTTLLKSMLATHPRVYLPPETFFFSTIRNKKKSVPGGDLESKIDYICSRWWMKDAGLTKKKLLERLDIKSNKDWEQLFIAVMGALIPEGEFDAIGEKTPAHVVNAPELLDMYPQSRVIHIVRDPRAVLASYRSAKVGTNEAAIVAREWKSAIVVHHALEEEKRYMMVHYEQLVCEPHETLQAVSDFIGIEYDAVMMRFHERKSAGFSLEQRHHAATQTPLFKSSINAWQKKLPPRQHSLLDAEVGGLMERLGYSRIIGLPAPRPWDFKVSVFKDFVHKCTVRRVRQQFKRGRSLWRINQLNKSSNI